MLSLFEVHPLQYQQEPHLDDQCLLYEKPQQLHVEYQQDR